MMCEAPIAEGESVRKDDPSMTIKTKTIADRIRHLKPCLEAIEWANDYISPNKAWRECNRGDWMLWILGTQAGKVEPPGRKKLVLCACQCARLAPQYTTDSRLLRCIETADKWAQGMT